METEVIVFLILAFVAIGSAIGMIINKNAVYSALFLILNFATVAIFYLMLGAPFIAMAQVTVYAGAIMVLFLFVIMLLGAEQLKKADKGEWQKPVAILFVVVLIVEAVYLIFGGGGDLLPMINEVSEVGDPISLATKLFKEYFLPFQVTAVLLLAAMVGAIVITKQDKKS
ncbi:MAG: NADH-quinone oxidoreductase subunit J [Chloroflexi bacterium]|jgi:NADH-quinone oxidoreductase subunit J|nr:NADH-quinone oxidoreductase subunit J [Chloroflexota bacterium]MBT3669181.1 NADH-quinone oxidoreductase subunit J [Chloroflexota bacterium]MBT4002717.1 NADH-quinone oxidoreductase subunit J [Chloroflexota bacterium]MBT4306426.1 NADH-quinone oxidoreductase subunit J [Chloroflexota bacterium]MBT4534925.1 NADH-quinone oxidoreductase subunit J [Chloroflexota bacterium]